MTSRVYVQQAVFDRVVCLHVFLAVVNWVHVAGAFHFHFLLPVEVVVFPLCRLRLKTQVRLVSVKTKRCHVTT